MPLLYPKNPIIQNRMKNAFIFVSKSKARIEESIKRVAKKKYKEDPGAGEKFIADSMGLLGIATSADEALKTADLVVEAVTENLGLKQKLFSSFDKIAPEHTIFT